MGCDGENMGEGWLERILPWAVPHVGEGEFLVDKGHHGYSSWGAINAREDSTSGSCLFQNELKLSRVKEY